MRKLMILWFLCLTLVPTSLEGQMKPFSKAPLSVPVATKAMEDNDTSKFFVNLDSMVTAMNLMFRDLRLEHRADMARLFRSLREVRCEDVARGMEVSFARTSEDGARIDLSGSWKRSCRSGEILLCDEARCYVSTWCWNINMTRFTPPSRGIVVTPPTSPRADSVYLRVGEVQVRHTADQALLDALSSRQVIQVNVSPEKEGWSRTTKFLLGGAASAILVGGAYCAFEKCWTNRTSVRIRLG